MIIAFILFLFSYDGMEMECIACKNRFKSSEVAYINTYNMGDEEDIKEACPKCKSDLIKNI